MNSLLRIELKNKYSLIILFSMYVEPLSLIIGKTEEINIDEIFTNKS